MLSPQLMKLAQRRHSRAFGNWGDDMDVSDGSLLQFSMNREFSERNLTDSAPVAAEHVTHGTVTVDSGSFIGPCPEFAALSS